jgi:hypothetical protein
LEAAAADRDCVGVPVAAGGPQDARRDFGGAAASAIKDTPQVLALVVLPALGGQ